MRRLLGARVFQVDSQGFVMELRCEVHNPNAFGAALHDVSFRANVGHFELGRGQVRGLVRQVEARSNFELEVPVRVDFARLPPDLPRRTAGGVLAMRTEVRFTARTRLGSYRMQLVSEDQTVIDQALRVAIKGSFSGEALRIERIQLRRVGLREVRLGLTARVQNLFPFALGIERAEYVLWIDGKRFAAGELARPLRLAPRQQTAVSFPIDATHGAVARAVGALATTDPQFRVRGTIWLEQPIAGIDQLPIDIRADSSVFVDDRDPSVDDAR